MYTLGYLKVMLAGLGPSLRWDDEYLKLREIPLGKLMGEKWKGVTIDDSALHVLRDSPIRLR